MRLLVIGGVAAGLSAAARARRIDAALDITVLEKGATISYGACGLPYYLEGRVRRAGDLIVYTPEYFRQHRNILVRTGARVVSIAHPRREVVLDGGERVPYDRLVIATGARPRALDLAGPPVFALHTLEDAERLKSYVRDQRPKRALVVGAGYLGLEAADALRRNGLAVTVVEQSAHVLHRGDAELTKAVRVRLERFRVELLLHTAATPARGYDLAIVAAGLKPNVELAAEAGVELGRTGAIRVDQHLETNLSGVYAAGDCAEALHLVTGRPAYIPLGTTANKMGRIAGANAAGRRERFGGVVGTAIVNVFGLGVGITGLSMEQARHDAFSPVAARITAPSRAGYFGGQPLTVELVADRATRRLLGGSVWGEDGVEGRINVIATALHNRMRVEDLEQLDLAYAPPFATVWDPVLLAAQQLSKLV
ncbi:MAG: FAD-dependent oxidoreductase [Bryobacteraceae bacterium]|jgi:NADPH-dependent 2,4-dienoyl-CoA reductase/sulfur reductase-like enzyme